MERKSARELRALADVWSDPPPPLGRRERLERWADLLDRDPLRMINTVRELEFACRAAQADMRADGSALSVAYNDPLFRSLGLNSDRLGDGRAFFGLSDAEAHRLLCSCRNGMSMRAEDAARMVRAEALSRSATLTHGLVITTLCMVPALFLFFS